MSQPPYDPPRPVGWQPPPKKPKAPLLLGILIGAVAPFAGLLVPVVFSGVQRPSPAADIAAFAPFGWVLLVLATGTGLLFPDDTRRWGVGILLGFFGMLIIGAGVCVAALVVIIAAYNGG